MKAIEYFRMLHEILEHPKHLSLFSLVLYACEKGLITKIEKNNCLEYLKIFSPSEIENMEKEIQRNSPNE